MAECGADINRYSQCVADAQLPLRPALHQEMQARSFQVLHEKAVRSIHPKAAHDIGMSQRQEDVGLALRGLHRLQHLAQHRAPGFVVPNKVDRLTAAIIDDTENGEVCTEPRAKSYFRSTFSHHCSTISVRSVDRGRLYAPGR